MTERALIAMSGGVDSSLAAALLLDQGYAVEGVTLKLTAGLCCDIAGARAVCARLGIPHSLLDLQQDFERLVVRDFIDQYRSGRTPNPCIRCNDLIKFSALLAHARAAGFDRLATGHYARIEPDPVSGRMLLKQGQDREKDQSYFLYRLDQNQLRSLLFPLGDLRKTEVRKRAAERGLPAAERPESQEVCFVPDDDYRSFLRERAAGALRPGDMVMTDGTHIGRHDGVALFTVGQRRGLGIAAGERLYVVRIEPERDRVVLGRREELSVLEMRLSQMHYLSGSAPGTPVRAQVKVRYRSAPIPCILHPEGNEPARVVLDLPASAAAPGQAAVLYDNETVLGGGIIER